MTAPSLLAMPFQPWDLSSLVTCASLVALAMYLTAARRAARWPRRRTLAFLAGVAALEVALESGLAVYDTYLLSAHMLQHLLLIEVAPALLLYGRPVHLALRTLRGARRRSLGRGLVTIRNRATPVLCLAVYSLIILGTHTPAFFDAATRHRGLHEVEHGLYVLSGLVIWWPLLGDPAPRRRLGAIGRLGYITVAMLPMTLIGAYLDRDQSLFYPAYRLPTRELGISPIFDQQRAGAIMWVAGTTLMAMVGLYSVVTSMLAAERQQRARELHEVTS